MVGHASTLACLAIVAALQQAGAQAPKLYVCQGGQCVANARGLPLSECEAVCAAPPNANYTCSGGQCVASARGLPKAQCTQVCGGPPPAPGGNTIVDLALATPDLSTLVTALKAGGLVKTLSGQGPFTVFAPTNEAFAALPAGVLANLLKPENKAALDNILTYHVVAGTYRASDLKDGERLKTLEGNEVVVRLAGKEVLINSAKVTTADVTASNGVVHIIDGVLLPAGPAPPPGPPGPPTPPPGPAPKGCTKAGCYFSFTWRAPAFGVAKFGGRCGEVDAAPRMPDDIWNDSRAVENYVEATCTDFSNDIIGTGVLSQEPCAPVGNTFPRPNRAWARNGTKQIDWLGRPNGKGPLSFQGFCRKRCGCSIIGTPKPDRPPCTDKPDNPPYYCSLCGPTLNAPIDVQLWYPTGAPPPPPACTPGGTPSSCNIVALAETVPTLKTLVTAVVAGNLSSTLSSGGPFTVFAPNDKAFSAIDPSVLASLLRPENIAELDALLELHVVSGTIRAKDIKDDQKIKTLAGGELTFDVTGGSEPKIFVYSKGTKAAQVIAADNIATNGVVHIINKVLQPE